MKVGDLFILHQGNGFELINMTQRPDSPIHFISRTSDNNGVVAKVIPVADTAPFPAGLMTVALGGSVLSSFVQNKPFYTGFHVMVLEPKKDMSLEEKLFYCRAIRMNAYRYQYGRQANRTLKNINLPLIPSWLKDYKINFTKIQTQNQARIFPLHTSDWKSYKMCDLFDMVRGTRITKENRTLGSIALITAGAQNEGVSDFIHPEKRDVYQNVLTIDMFCNCFYHEYSFSCDDNILVLLPKFEQNKFRALFLATVINQDKTKYAYGRQYRQKDFNNHVVKLPAKNVNGKYEPDWQYMESYIKNLPYGDLI